MPQSPTCRVLHACAVVLLALITNATISAGQRPVDDLTEVRALWVTRATMTSQSAIDQMVESARSGGFNTILVQVRGRGDAYYTSEIEPRAADLGSRPGFDPLEATIAAASRAGLRVHAWVVANLVSSAVDLPSARTHVVYRHPEWLMVPRDIAQEMLSIDPRNPAYLGRLARWSRAHADRVEGLYTSPLHAAAARHLADVVSDIATRYAVDGVHLDYIRYPSESFDYSRAAIDQFKQSVRA